MLTIEGAGVHFKRAFGFQHSLSLIRFCFFMSSLGEPEGKQEWLSVASARGIETIMYVLEGEIRHEDSLGNKGLIRPGFQRMEILAEIARDLYTLRG